MPTICFDVDGTLIQETSDGVEVPNYPIIWFIDFLKKFTFCEVFVWSGGGTDYAERWVKKLGLTDIINGIIEKGSITPDITFDDQNCTLGQVNLKVNDYFYES